MPPRTTALAALMVLCWCGRVGASDAAALAAEAFGIAPDAVDGSALGVRCRAGCGVVTHLQRALQGVGFHRRLVTEVEASWSLPRDRDASAALQDCTLALLESLPPGAFADTYELAGEARAGAPPARVYGVVNVERPAPECAPSVVAVLAPANATAVGAGTTLRASVRVSLPLHARYPAPAPPPAPLARVLLPPPRVLLRCGGDTPWRAAELAPDAAADAALVWEVPAGNLAHAELVERVSAAAGLAGALVVLWRLRALPTPVAASRRSQG